MIPGVVVTDELLALAERHGASPDKGRAFFVDLAAKHLAVVRGLGFDGVYLGGHMPAETFGEILDRAQAVRAGRLARVRARDPVRRVAGEFHFFERDPETGLSSDVVNAAYLESKRQRRTDLRVPLKYRLQPPPPRHGVRERRAALRRPAGRVYRARREGAREPCGGLRTRSSRPRRCRSSAARTAATARSPRSRTSAPSRSARRTSATARAAGRATACARCTTRSASGREAYERLKAYGEEESMLDGPVVVKDNALAGTSAWANTFLGRDHLARAGPDPRDGPAIVTAS